jgi:hypothetical protein
MKISTRVFRPLVSITVLVMAFSVEAKGQNKAMALDRVMDQVIIEGGGLEKTNGRAMAKTRLMAFQNGKLSPVPFQIDEKTPGGDYVMSRPDGTMDKDTDQGRLDNNDELVFMAHDAGDKGDPAATGLSPAGWDEIRLHDPQTGAQGWVYLIAFDQDPPEPSPINYMQYNEKAECDELISPHYTLRFPKNDVFIRDFMVHESAGGNKADLMDRIKMRSGIGVLSGRVTVSRTEDDFVHEVLGLIKGPVRVIRQTGTQLVIILSLKSPSAVVNGSFYPCSFQFPSMISLPFRMDLVASDAWLRQGWDLNRNAIGWRFYSNLNPEGVTMDGRMSPEEEKLSKKRDTLRWALLTGEQGSFIFTGQWDMSTPIKALLYYEDDLSRQEPPEDEPGVMGFAYKLEDLQDIGGEAYPFNIVNYVVPNYDGDIDRALRVLQHPLEVQVNP